MPLTNMLLSLALLLVRPAATMPRESIERVANLTLCRYIYKPDISSTRTPQLIPHVECLGKDTQRKVVYIDGQYNRTCTCTEISATMKVTYTHIRGTRDVNYVAGCACVDISANPVNRVEPDNLVD